MGPAVLGEIGWYDINVQKISLGGEEFSNFNCDPSQPGQQCIMDTWLRTFLGCSCIYNPTKSDSEVSRLWARKLRS